jgi:tyrosine-protein phosphatase 2/3
MLKKFKIEGWTGTSHIMRGGFQDFSKQFPNFIHYDAGSSSGTDSESPSGVAPVIGGCPMPTTKNAANPFFGNIRQNMDLIGGVGQIPLKRTRSMISPQIQEMPKWLRLASDEEDKGKLIADKFLAIEKEEQRRMQEALSEKVNYSSSEPQSQGFKIAGIEKGNKNRYTNIWPYEHSRVKLQGVRDGACDYVNANHVKSTWSHKRYIATQGPIPATFNVSILCFSIYQATRLTFKRIFGMLCGSKMFV